MDKATTSIKTCGGAVELLAPAGDLDKAKLAFLYGADAVYLGGAQFGLRAKSTLGDDEIEQVVEFAHANGKRVYVTVNIFARNRDFDDLVPYLKHLEKVRVDAVIVSDLGVLGTVRAHTKLPVHISTQANVLNKFTAAGYVKLGAERIILARECSLDEIKEIAAHIAPREIEVFVHGAMCVSYSGRCMLSNYMVGRESNRGECAHPCRWKYALVEEKRQGEFFEIDEDGRGTYIMNSKDLCLVNHIQSLVAAGVKSFKIEGRNKSEYYVASVVRAYRDALGGHLGAAIAEVDKSSHRPYTTGFVVPDNTLYEKSAVAKSPFEVVARVIDGGALSQRNVFCVGDELEILSFGANHNKTFTVSKIEYIDKAGARQSTVRANQAEQTYFVPCPFELQKDEFLRKRAGVK